MKQAIVRKLTLTLVGTSKVWGFLPEGFQWQTRWHQDKNVTRTPLDTVGEDETLHTL